ncbi:helix-turn-helix domain-containing protein [Zhouia spongiae]|uniref:Helix-turn-helix domain-containing protein n=1 Tax=Zhouia spongiae TaxID=2202721 RepID=A0ABY3YJS0_9FLAO|nr:helix-turn-helix domain-containing protein [Zhouia spongiae]UNY97901.1 helix-turn-helix domain-containing protein [Zhouia spongiae]
MEDFKVDCITILYNDKPSNCDDVRMLFVLEGFIVIKIGDKVVDLIYNQLLIVPPKINLLYNRHKCVKGYYISFSYTYYVTNGVDYLDSFLKNYFRAETYTKIPLSYMSSIHLGSLVYYLQLHQGGDNTYNDLIEQEIYLLRFNLLLLELTNCLHQFDKSPKALFDKNRRIAFDFLKLLDNYITYNHSVKFYAGKLNITPTQLSRVLKRITKKTAKEFIQNAIVQKAKFQLLNSDLKLNELASRLGFSDVIIFGRFFKRHTGITPLHYRKINYKRKKPKQKNNLKP